MTSSVLNGAGAESPAPPAFSPLTDPADPGNREPSVNVNLDPSTDGADAAHDVNDPSPNNDNANPSAALPVDSKASEEQQPPLAGPAPDNIDTAMTDAMDLDPLMNPAMDYTAGAGVDFYQHPSQLLMALARLSAASQTAGAPPLTVRPSNMLLDTPETPLQTNDATHGAPPVDHPLESFARIEFADSVFQMTTYAVVIGRDQRALEQARKDERRLEEYQRKVRENEQLGLPAPSPPTQERGKFSKSYVSEEGGMLGPESDGEDQPRPAKRRKMSGGAGSASGDSHRQESANGEPVGQEDKNLTFNRQYVSHTPGAAAVNLSALRPSPYYVPFIGIHSPGPNIASRTKAISREHLRIQFNPKKGVFEAIPLHKNGFFCEDVHYKDEPVVLRSGDRLQIKDVDFVFIINGVPRGKTGAEECMEEDGASSRRYSEGGKEMSFDFESSHDVERRSTSPEEEVAGEAAQEDSDSELSELGEDIPEPEEVADQEVMETIEKDGEDQTAIKPEIPPELLADFPPIPKKRGPGRPPKNGIMSKREERLRKKAAMELAKKNMPQPPPGDPPVKRKVGRPRKHPLPENAPDRPEKRKYKPRKSKSGEEGEGSDPEKAIKERRREKPKTPPLELNREDFTEEQLQKPNKNYGVLIDEVLSAAPNGLTLKQIYKRIQIKYPYYYFAGSKGWESSVRHNLIGNDAFKKNEETHLWSRVAGIDIDAGKKRKASSPDRSTSLHAFGQHYPPPGMPPAQMVHGEALQHHGYRPGSGPQRPGYPPGPGQGNFGQQAQPQFIAQGVGAAAQQPNRPAYPPPMQVSGAAHTTGSANPGAARPLPATTQMGSYSSPYASRPQPIGAVQPGVPVQAAAGQNFVSQSQANPVNGLPRVETPSTQAGGPGSAGPRPAQPAPMNSTDASLKPAVAPELVRYVTNFKKTVTEQLAKRTSAAEALAMSVINRGLGLTTESTVPNEQELEKIVYGVFESSRKNLGANQSLHPGLVQALVNFKDNMTKTLEPRMGKLSSERLILSAVDRVLGFADTSTMPDKERYQEAETVLIPAIKRVVTEHQKTVAAVASSASTPALTPAPSASKPAAPPAATVAFTGTPNPAVKPPQTTPTPAHSVPAIPRPPVSAPPPATARPTAPATAPATATRQVVTPAASPAQVASQIPPVPKPPIPAQISASTHQIPGHAAAPAPANSVASQVSQPSPQPPVVGAAAAPTAPQALSQPAPSVLATPAPTLTNSVVSHVFQPSVEAAVVGANAAPAALQAPSQPAPSVLATPASAVHKASTSAAAAPALAQPQPQVSAAPASQALSHAAVPAATRDSGQDAPTPGRVHTATPVLATPALTVPQASASAAPAPTVPQASASATPAATVPQTSTSAATPALSQPQPQASAAPEPQVLLPPAVPAAPRESSQDVSMPDAVSATAQASPKNPTPTVAPAPAESQLEKPMQTTAAVSPKPAQATIQSTAVSTMPASTDSSSVPTPPPPPQMAATTAR
ncbi:hypothetical protein N656DRAFT_777991 [Canariomyces notabilis]|uniref:Fork-head domain-containing protein n=1 Tax=Canariomyces notabilis TaxID=2074819 RepID=A0AAN6THE8_9PEZI|nr:hypothetical protein N656DRAFT_777991 [Canariomyces arenarius]